MKYFFKEVSFLPIIVQFYGISRIGQFEGKYTFHLKEWGYFGDYEALV